MLMLIDNRFSPLNQIEYSKHFLGCSFLWIVFLSAVTTQYFSQHRPTTFRFSRTCSNHFVPKMARQAIEFTYRSRQYFYGYPLHTLLGEKR